MKKKKIIFYLFISFLHLIFLDTPINKKSSAEHLFDSYRLKKNEFFLNKNSYDYLINKLENADNNLIPKYQLIVYMLGPESINSGTGFYDVGEVQGHHGEISVHVGFKPNKIAPNYQ